ncbi:glucosamine/galactosamine-6-phosphate isomerase [Tolypothrix tenuis PCC 7101]|uniref:Glucosamine/galactosamine-6-phosphate isomerase n=1 Tax=Tolypothrix tenuis PCC 7101 TaxID=231146 RepID=A0A1Z4MWJ6_9CYAN|nr:glucosamine-6-phosphate deaminase [Aulosira sp. FACHB-113]BAY97811.1 glucosamine/galactosamine-6-phosphate isomerase [Tolypothrix tenuis PCC 7101]BAZ71682.1 glucosamine/galactosamine-6-phosphate isomerase [Aulosira laxa NIES-50]
MLAATKSFRVDELTVQIYNNESEMAQDVAAIAQQYLQNVLQQKDTAAVLLATGNSQLKFLDALINLGGVDWSRIILFHLDEYLGISSDHAASFRRYLRELVEQRVHPKQFHYIEGDTLQPLAECDRYSKLLQAQSIDLCCLGVGENGHLAFNDPYVADFQDPYRVKLVKLDAINRQQQVNTGQFPSLENVPQYAFTVTLPVICAAKKIICLAPDKRKANIVKDILHGPINTKCPASILRQQNQATLFIDTNSASLLADISNY